MLAGRPTTTAAEGRSRNQKKPNIHHGHGEAKIQLKSLAERARRRSRSTQTYADKDQHARPLFLPLRNLVVILILFTRNLIRGRGVDGGVIRAVAQGNGFSLVKNKDPGIKFG